MTKPIQSDASIRRRKKIQGNISIAGGTLGLTALGAKGGSVALAGGRAGRLLKVKANHQMSQKLKDASTGLTTLGAGIGGLGAYNFASYTKAEARKRPRQAVKKNSGGLMDFGLSGVEQGSAERYEEVSKAGAWAPPKLKPWSSPQGTVKGTLYEGIKTPFNNQARSFSGTGRNSVSGNPTPMNFKQKGSLTPLGKKTAVGTAGAALVAAPTLAISNARKDRPRKPQGVAKRADWKNISEHQRRARDSRRTRNRGESAAGLGGTTLLAATAHQARSRGKYKPVGDQVGDILSGARTIKANYKWDKTTAGRLVSTSSPETRAWQSTKALARSRPHGTAALAGGALMAGGLATSAGARANEKRHDRAIARQRKARVKKAYDPERNRQRRLDHTATALSAGAGASALGAGKFATKAYGKKVSLPGGKTGHTGLRAKSLPAYKAGVKSAGKAGALGLTAVGLAVGSDRVRGYKKGRGGRYRPLAQGWN